MDCRTLSLPQHSYFWQASLPGSLMLFASYIPPSDADLVGPWSPSLESLPQGCYVTFSVYSGFLLLDVSYSFLYLKKIVGNFIYAHIIFSPSSKWRFFSNVSCSGRLRCPPLNLFGIIVLGWLLSVTCSKMGTQWWGGTLPSLLQNSQYLKFMSLWILWWALKTVCLTNELINFNLASGT